MVETLTENIYVFHYSLECRGRNKMLWGQVSGINKSINMLKYF